MKSPHPVEFAGAEGNRLAGDLHDGGGTPILLLHGGGQTRHAWAQTSRRLAGAGWRAISVDLRGHGDSAWVASRDYRYSAYVADVAAIAADVAARYGEAPAAIGASLGGLSALGAELLHGSVLSTLVLVDVTPWMDPEGVARIQGFMRTHAADGFATLDDAADAIALYLPHRKRPRSLDGLAKNLRRSADGRYRWHWDPAFLDSPLGINVGALEHMERMRDLLGGLRIPTLLVRGLLSELIHEREAALFLAATPNARAVDVGGAGHMVAGDRNDVFTEAILDFLAS